MDAVLEHINWVDLVAVVILLASGLFAYFRGFTHELLSVVSWALAIILAVTFFPMVTPYVTEYITDVLIAQILSGIAIFLVTLVIAGLISSWLASKVLNSGISALDRSLGFLYGLIRGAVLISLAFLIMHQIVGTEGHPPMVTESRSAPYGAEGARFLVRLSNALLPEKMHLDSPDSPFSQMQDDARQTFEEQTAPLRQLNEAVETIDALTNPRNTAPAPGSESGTGYSVEEKQNLEALIEQETTQ